MLEAAVIGLFALMGVITQRVVGFGIAPFLSPIALIFFSPPVAIVTTLLTGTISCFLIILNARRNSVIQLQVVARILITAIPGLLLGAYIVTRIDKAWLQIILGCIVIAAILIQEYALPKPTRAFGVTRRISAAGFLSGLLNAAAANGAPPMVMWLRTHKITPEQIRQNIAGIFIVVNLCSLTAIHFSKPSVFGHQVLVNFIVLLPTVLVGNLIGTSLINRVDRKLYEKLVVITVILTALVSIGLGVVNKL